jgi:hypothetical protein
LALSKRFTEVNPMANKDEWLHFIEEEDGEMFAFELIDVIIINSQRVLFQKQIDIQILPYTVNFAEQVINVLYTFLTLLSSFTIIKEILGI